MALSEFDRLFGDIRAWGTWGSEDESGAINYLGENQVLGAVSKVLIGKRVSLGAPIETAAHVNNPRPLLHYLVQETAGTEEDDGLVEWASDFIALEYHGDAHTHLDALSHCAYRGRLFNDHDPIRGSSTLGSHGSVDVVARGIVGRGVLLDLPFSLGLKWLEPGQVVLPEDLGAAEAAEGVHATEGDVVLVRVGQRQREVQVGRWDRGEKRTGLHPTCIQWMSDRHVAMVGAENDSETRPSVVQGLDWPIHVLALNAAGIWMLDNLLLDDLADACSQERRWEFLILVAPLRVFGGTGSPVNPIAVL